MSPRAWTLVPSTATDKQPEMVGWSDALRRSSRSFEVTSCLVGGADDGYAAFAALSALSALEQFAPRARA